jgi:hypothetical protein
MKPGWQTTEFWLTLAAQLVAALLASGALAEGSLVLKIVAGLASVLGLLGYTVARTYLKS